MSGHGSEQEKSFQRWSHSGVLFPAEKLIIIVVTPPAGPEPPPAPELRDSYGRNESLFYSKNSLKFQTRSFEVNPTHCAARSYIFYS